jgi:hypothetical protein
MYRAQLYEGFLTSASADFARRMVNIMPQNDYLTNFQHFCAYFEFAITELLIIYSDLIDKHYDGFIDEASEYLEQSYFNGTPIMNPENDRAIGENAFNDLCGKFMHYVPLVMHARLASSWIGTDRTEDQLKVKNKLSAIEKEAKASKIRFSTIPLAVYHWRKHTYLEVSDQSQELLSMGKYLDEANLTVAKGYYIPDSTFKFIERINPGNRRHYRLVAVTKTPPVELISYYVKEITY